MGKEELSRAHKLVALLVTPTTVKPDGSEKSWFLSILEAKSKEYVQSVDGAVVLSGGDGSFDYVRCCVNALVNLKLELVNAVTEERETPSKGARLDADSLSISQQKSVGSLVEMVVALGLLPNLVPGVGLQLHKRSDFLQSVLKDLPERKILEKYKQLNFSLESLLELSKHRSFSTLVYTKHVADIIAALVQISAAPLMQPVEADTVAAGDIALEEDKFVMTDALHQRLSADQKLYSAELSRIVEKSYQPMVVKNLLVLHGSAKDKGKESKTPPKWFSKKISELLTARLTDSMGVANVIRGVLDIGGDAESMDWQKIGLVASVLGNPPEGNYASVEAYYQKICPQLLDLLNHEDKVYQMIVCASVKTVSERSMILSRRYLLDVLMGPFVKLCDEEMGLGVTEQELDDCLKSLYKVFVIGNDPDMMFLNNLEKIVLILLDLHASIALGASHLRDPVKQILLRYIKHLDKETAVIILRCFAMSEVPAERVDRMKLLHRDLVMVAGDEGGIKVAKRTDAEESFYVSDDMKSIVLQDFLEDLKDPQLSVDFYMSLMADLTDMMVTESLPEPEVPEPKEGQSMESQLLELEAHMDKSMHKMRRNLMVIRLLGLMSEDKPLQDLLLKESSRMIEFTGATLKRGAMTLGASSEGDAPGVMAVQSLNMALSILSIHLTQADVSVKDWEKMLEYSSDMEVLSCHPDKRISRISGQLNQLVITHAAIITETRNIKEKTRNMEEQTRRMKEKTLEMKNMKKDSENKQMDEKMRKIREKAEELRQAKEKRKNKGFKEEEKEMKIVEDKTGMSLYESALYDIGDPLLPVRGHGIIELTKLIDAKDPETLVNTAKIYQIFVESLEDEDTYIYLSAITGLVSCARYSTEEVLATLTTEFTQVYQRKNLGDKAMEVRTKVGEALVRVSKELGEMTPKYKNLLLNAFFSAANDPDEMVRASSLSNIGEVCRNLRFSLGPITGELMLHLESSSRDVCPEVRRAAAMVLTMLLEGLGRDAFAVLESSLREILKSLRLRLGVETDEVALVHINLALDEIDKIVRDMFSPNLTQEKKIFVLN